MESLSKDLLREIFSYLDPLEYRNLSIVSKRLSEISKSPLRNHIIYKGSLGKNNWMMKLDCSGNVLSLIISVEKITEDLLHDYVFKLEVDVQSKDQCVISKSGYLEGNLDRKHIYVFHNTTHSQAEAKLTLKEGRIVDSIKIFSDGRPLKTFHIYDGVPPNPSEFVVFKDDENFSISYKGGKISHITHPDYDIILNSDGKYWKRTIPGRNFTLHNSEILGYLPPSLTFQQIPVKADNFSELILPLRIVNCWNKEKAGQQVKYLLNRFMFYTSFIRHELRIRQISWM